MDARQTAEAVIERAGEIVGGLGFAVSWYLEESKEGFDLAEVVAAAQNAGWLRDLLSEATDTELLRRLEFERENDGNDNDG
jgi:hypothetical protein